MQTSKNTSIWDRLSDEEKKQIQEELAKQPGTQGAPVTGLGDVINSGYYAKGGSQPSVIEMSPKRAQPPTEAPNDNLQTGLSLAKTGMKVYNDASNASNAANAANTTEGIGGSLSKFYNGSGNAWAGTASGAGAYLGAAGGAYAAYNNWKSLDGAAGKLNYNDKMSAASMAAAGAAIGSVIPGVGTAIGAVIGGAYGFFADDLRTGKGKDQLKRDLVREGLEKKKFLDKDGRFTLKDGTTFEMGKDGGFKYADGMRAYEVDHKNPLQSVTFGHALPIAEMLTNGDPKLTSDFAGYLTRAAISNTTDLNSALDNVKDMAERLGVNQEGITNYTKSKVAEGTVTPEESAAYIGGIGNLFAPQRNLNFAGLNSDADKSRPVSGPARAQSQTKTDRIKNIKKAVKVVRPVMAPITSPAVSAEEASKAWGNAYGEKEKQASANYSFLGEGSV